MDGEEESRSTCTNGQIDVKAYLYGKKGKALLGTKKMKTYTISN